MRWGAGSRRCTWVVIKAATQVQVAHVFGVKAIAVRRWDAAHTGAGVSGLAPELKDPKRKSKLTAHTVATVRRLCECGATYRSIACQTGLSMGGICTVLINPDVGKSAAPTASDVAAQPQPVAPPAADSSTQDAAAPAADRLDDAAAPGLADPLKRDVERVLARMGLIASAPPVFTACARAPLAGLLLAVPVLAATGLIECVHEVYGALPNGFYSLDAVLCEALFRALLGESRAEGAARIDPVALGRVLGLDRAPEVKTIRRKIGYLAAAAKAGDWIAAMARRHLEARPEQAAVFYIDGHVRAYQDTRKIAKTHVPRLKRPAPATAETWVADAAGDPLLVVMAQPAALLAAEIRRLIPQLRATVGDNRRVLVGFDRGGWPPTLFADLDETGFDVLTWRKDATTGIDEHHFVEHNHTDEHGRTHTWSLADTETTLDIAEGPRAGQVLMMRQISLQDAARTQQMHILTTRRDLPATQIRYRMGSRWRQENRYRYGRTHFDLDSHDSYQAGDNDPTRIVPNPAKKPAYQQAEKPAVHCIQPK